jgi:hypothetical protein
MMEDQIDLATEQKRNDVGNRIHTRRTTKSGLQYTLEMIIRIFHSWVYIFQLDVFQSSSAQLINLASSKRSRRM